MISFKDSNFPFENSTGILVEKYISVQAAAELTGYNIQYLRRLLRSGAMEGVKIGQMWLIEMDALGAYLKHVENTSDRRCGPR
jgi:excisionase family DNA binding protein